MDGLQLYAVLWQEAEGRFDLSLGNIRTESQSKVDEPLGTRYGRFAKKLQFVASMDGIDF